MSLTEAEKKQVQAEMFARLEAAESKLSATERVLAEAEKALERVMQFWGSHEAWGDFASLNSAAVAFSRVADECRNGLASIRGLSLDRARAEAAVIKASPDIAAEYKKPAVVDQSMSTAIRLKKWDRFKAAVDALAALDQKDQEKP